MDVIATTLSSLAQPHWRAGCSRSVDRVDECDRFTALVAVESMGATFTDGIDEILQLAAVSLGADRAGIARSGTEIIGLTGGADGIVFGAGITEFPTHNAIIFEDD